MALPKVVIVPTGGTIQNGQPLVSSNKAGGDLNLLRAQRLHEAVTVKIAKEDLDGNPMSLNAGEDPFWTTTLDPEDGLYLLPPMQEGYVPPTFYAPVHRDANRIVEEIDRFGLDTYGRNNLLSREADLRVEKIIDPQTGRELRAGGNTFTIRELSLIANQVNRVLSEEEVVGCVVTHGTFTVEETACFLNYTVNSDKPVVVCASQRRHSSVGNDGDWNLVDGVRVAVDPEARGKGVMLMMNEQILPAREVTKTNQRPDGFVSTGGTAGALGSVESDQVTFYFAPTRKHTSRSEVRVAGDLPEFLPRVDIVKTYAGADDVPILALIERALRERSESNSPHRHGIVVEGFAYSGNPHQYQRPALERAMTQHGIPVVITNRGDYGRAPHVPEDLFITGDNFISVKARLLLTLAIEKLGLLTPYADPEQPTSEEQARMAQELQRYQEIFDTH
ncbi:MAG: asparaginase [Dehalococcoidia bacterium]